MNRLFGWLSRLRVMFSGRKLDEEFDQEVRSHLSLLEQENIRQGMSSEEARYAALRSFGGVTQVKESNREHRGFHWLELFFQDLRYAARMMGRNPGFTAVALVTLALGIGANTAIFSVVEGVLLAPLPYEHSEKVMAVLQQNLTMKHVTYVSYPDFLDWQRDAQSFELMAAANFRGFDLTSPGTPEHVRGEEVSSGFFSTLGAKLALGREFLPEEDRQNGPPAVVISDRVWRDRFGGSRQALGKTMTLTGVDYTVVGVLPPDFRPLDESDVYTPLGQYNPLLLHDRTIHPILPIGRLKDGVSRGQAEAEISTIQEHLNQLYPEADRGVAASVMPLKQLIVEDVTAILLLLLGAVGLVLLIACANIANLLLSRSAGRKNEFAVRLALGASRARIVRQLITESSLLAVVGGGLGLGLARLGIGPVLAMVHKTLPRSDNVGVNLPVLLFTFIVAIVVGILSGLGPALNSSKAELQDSLKAAGRGVSHARQRTQHILITVQMAVTIVLLVGASLLFRTVHRLWQTNPGFDTQHIISFKIGLTPAATKEALSMRNAYEQLTERIREIPGVQEADQTVLVPLSGDDNSGPFWVGPQPVSMAEAPRATYYWTGTNYLKTMGITLLRGRYFVPEDNLQSQFAIVIDSYLAHTFFPDKDPVGRTINIGHIGPARIIGVAEHVRHWDLANSNVYTQNQIYGSLSQLPDRWLPGFYPDMTIVVRTPLEVATIMPTIKAAVYGTGSDQPVYSIRTMQEMASESMLSQRFPLVLLGTFAGLALLLAVIGIYGVLSYSMAQRVHEIGVRMALGAARGDVLRMMMEQGLRLAIVGAAVGTAAALIFGRVLPSFSHLLYGVQPSDPLTLTAVSLVLVNTALLACYVPARRAAKVDPMVALRNE